MRKGRENKMKVIVKVWNGSKYEAASEVCERLTYDIKDFEIIHKADDHDIEANFAPEELDPCDEYLRLYLEDGNTATFRNSRVDMFRW